MTQHKHDDRGGPTTYPATPGDRNEAKRAEREFGRPADEPGPVMAERRKADKARQSDEGAESHRA
jgi:hypothetical protein